MVKGQIAKEEIKKKILEVFEGSFTYDKEIRIPVVENGETVEIKVALTCAKVNVGADAGQEIAEAAPAANIENKEITAQEISEVKDIIDKLNL